MKVTEFVLSAALVGLSTALPGGPWPRHPEGPESKPAAFFLAGDSTTAAQTDYGGGWGNGFLNTLENGAMGANFGHNGATTVSFVTGGDWADLLESVQRSKANYKVFVTIQFGHNDQKASANISVEEYTENLSAFATTIQGLGAHPILVTPISRRGYNSSKLVTEDLAVQAAATIAAAKNVSSDYIDLNRASTEYLDKIGPTDGVKYNRIPSDFTHLNAPGSIVFGNLVSYLMGNIAGDGKLLKQYTVPQPSIVHALQNGTFIFPAVPADF